MKSLFITGVALLVGAGAFTAMAEEGTQTQTRTTVPRLLVNMQGRTGTTSGSALTEAETGWYNWKQDNDPYVPGGNSGKYLNTAGVCESSAAGVKFRVNRVGGNHRSEWSNPSSKTFDTGSYTNIFGDVKTSLLEEVKSSLSLPSGTDFTSKVWDAGLGNGGEPRGKGEVLGLEASKTYVMYVGICKQVKNESTFPDAYGGFKLESGKYGQITKLQYVVTDALNKTVGSESINTVKAACYTDFTAETRVSPDKGGLMIVRYVGKPNESGEIQFDLGGLGAKSDGARSGIAFIAISEIVEGVTVHTATVSDSGEKNWSSLIWDPVKPDGGFPANAQLTVSMPSGGTLVFDEAVSLPECSLTITGENVKLKAGDSFFTDGCWEKTVLSCNSFSHGTATTADLKEGFGGAYTIGATGIKLRAQNREVISINIAGGKSGGDGATSEASNKVSGTDCHGILPVPGDSWNNIDSQWQNSATNRTLTVTNAKAYTGSQSVERATMAFAATGKNTWQADSISNPFLRGYLDDGGGVKVEVEGIPYEAYDVIVYATSDNSGYKLAPITVNGTSYTFKNGATVEGTTIWGEALAGSPELGKNAIMVTNQSRQTLTITSTRTSDNNNNGRATLAAVQIIARSATVLEKSTHKATIEEGTNSGELTKISYDNTFKEGKLSEVQLTVNGASTAAEYVLTIDKPEAVLEKIVINAPQGRKVKIVTSAESANIALIKFNTLCEIQGNLKSNIYVESPGKLKYVVSDDAEYPFGEMSGTGDAILGAAAGKTLTIKKAKAVEYTFGNVEIPAGGTVKIGTTATDASFKFAATNLIVSNATFNIGSRDAIDGVRNIVATNNACLTTGAFLMIPTVTLADSRIELTGGYDTKWKNWCMNGKLSAYGNSSIRKMSGANGHTSIHLMYGEFWVDEGATLTLNVPMVDKPSDRSGNLQNQIKKTGKGTMIIEANPTKAYYSGITAVEDGTLVYEEPRTGLTAQQNFTVSAGATLKGGGTIKGAALVKLLGEGATLGGSLSVDKLEVAEGAALGGAASPMTNLTINTSITKATDSASPTVKVLNGTASIAAAEVGEGIKFKIETPTAGSVPENGETVLDIGGKRNLTLGGTGALKVNLTEAESKTPRVELFTAEESLGKNLTIKSLKVGEKEFTHNSMGLIYSDDNKGILKIWIRGVMLLFGRIGF